MDFYKIQCDLYEFGFYFFFGDWSGEEIFERLRDEGHDPPSSASFEIGGSRGICFNMGGGPYVGIWMKEPPHAASWVATLAHEALHASFYVGEYIGIKPGYKAEEFFAYLTGWVVKHALALVWSGEPFSSENKTWHNMVGRVDSEPMAQRKKIKVNVGRADLVAVGINKGDTLRASVAGNRASIIERGKRLTFTGDEWSLATIEVPVEDLAEPAPASTEGNVVPIIQDPATGNDGSGSTDPDNSPEGSQGDEIEAPDQDPAEGGNANSGSE